MLLLEYTKDKRTDWAGEYVDKYYRVVDNTDPIYLSEYHEKPEPKKVCKCFFNRKPKVKKPKKTEVLVMWI